MSVKKGKSIHTTKNRTNIRTSDYTDQVWTWESEDGIPFFFDMGEIVRFRVETENWHDQIPNAPDQAEFSLDRKPPYSIIVSFPPLFLSYSHSLVREPMAEREKKSIIDIVVGFDADGWPGTRCLVGMKVTKVKSVNMDQP